MTPRHKKQIVAFGFFLLFLAVWSLLLYQFPADEMVKNLGVTNGFAVAFIAGFLGGVSTFTSAPYPLVVITLGAGGLNPFLLGLVAASGLFLGDVTSYFFGYYGHHVVPNGLQTELERFRNWMLGRKRAWMAPVLIFLYGAFFPLSNDIVIISFGLARYPFWRVMLPLGLGSIIFNTILAFLGKYGLEYFL
mgnify:CR=1 FL=1